MEIFNDIDPLVMAGAGILVTGIIIVLFIVGAWYLLAGRWDRQMAQRLDAGALAAPYEDLSVLTRDSGPEELLLVHRDQPRETLGTVTAVPSGFRGRYGAERPTTYPTAEEAAYALAARHVELAPVREADARAAEDNARELQKFGESPRR